MEPITRIRQRYVKMMRESALILNHMLSGVTQAEATTYRDSGDGWTVLEVLCHVRDYEAIFHHRAIMMLEHDHPTLPAYDHAALAIERRYNEQTLSAVCADFMLKRQAFMQFFEGLEADQWDRTGVHPEREHFSLNDALLQAVTHTVDHTEQITRILVEKLSGASV